MSIVAAFVVVTIIGVSAYSYSPLANSIDIQRGHALFQNRCASCHSVDPDGLAARGPNLGTLKDRKPYGDRSLTDYVIESILNPEAFRSTEQYGYMPNVVQGLAKSELADLVGYLVHEVGGEQSLSELSFTYASIASQEVKTNLDREHLDYQTINKGREIFMGKGKCASCHDWIAWEGSVLEKPGSKAPNLRNISTKPIDYVRESILEPNKFILSGFESTLLVLEDGTTVNGLVIRENETNLVIFDSSQNADSQMLHIEKSTIEEMKTIETSIMPSYKDVLTKEELEAVLAFLSYL